VFGSFFFENGFVDDIMLKKCGGAGEATNNNMAYAHFTLGI
jgi:hypothetical protein